MRFIPRYFIYFDATAHGIVFLVSLSDSSFLVYINATDFEAGCSQEEGPKKGFVMGSRTQGVQEILEKCM